VPALVWGRVQDITVWEEETSPGQLLLYPHNPGPIGPGPATEAVEAAKVLVFLCVYTQEQSGCSAGTTGVLGVGTGADGANVLTPREATWYASLMTGENYRRIAPLYWFRDTYGNYLDTRGYMRGLTAFCFFDSEQRAEDFLKRWLTTAQSPTGDLQGTDPVTGDPIARDNWEIHHSDDADQLLAMCDELSRWDHSPPYDGFFIDPPHDPNSPELPMTLEGIKAEIEHRAAQP
jgi:hypothetical protein